jgi:NADH-ubiquinone oxidoreductase subunit 10
MALRMSEEQREKLFPSADDAEGLRSAGASIDPHAVLTAVYKDTLLDGKPIALRVQRYYPRVRDFDRDAEGNVIPSSLTGPDRLEARRQIARERAVAAEELKMLRSAVDRCSKLEGVNNLENCKHLVKAYAKLLEQPFYGMLGAPAHH